MGKHQHLVNDTDVCFKIDTITRNISSVSGKSALIQGDHNSERFTFELSSRNIEDHDMSLCNVVQIHYINIDSESKEKNIGVYEVDDLKISEDDENTVVLSWLISSNATKFAGSLNFIIKFKCVADDGTVDYVWNTEVYKGIRISDGIDNSGSVVENYSDILERWRKEILEACGTIQEEIESALTQAKESGEFDGKDGISSVVTLFNGEELDGRKRVTIEVSRTDENGVTITSTGVVRDGKKGDPGKSPYEYAKEAGYTGTEEEFAEKLLSSSGYPNPCVKDYGAYGDGSTDDTEAFQTALNENRVVFVPRGTYKLSGELVIKDNGCLELSQDTVLEFTNTSGNCINIGMLSHLKGNHATIKVPYVFSGNVLYAYSNDSTSVDQQSVPPWSKWDPQWKTGRYVTDINITKADYRGFHYLVNAGECKGTAVYISAKYTTGLSTFMWGVHYSGLRIAGAFAYGIHAKNINDGWLHEMRIENAFIDACETGVCLEDCSQTYVSATIQPRRGYTDGNVYFPYAKNGIKLVRSKNTDLSGSRVWDWQNADKPSSTENEKTTLYELGNEYQEIAMYGDCSGTIVNDFHYHSHGDTRNRIYSDDDHNLETLTILQEPIDRWFKVIGGEPYFTDGLTTRKLLDENALDSFVYVDAVKNFTDVLATATEADGVTVFNNIGYQVGKRFTSLGTGTDLADSVYYMTTGFIRVPLGSTIYGKGLKFDDTAKTYAGIVYYNDKYERVASMSITLVVNGNQYYVINYKSTGDGFSVQIPNSTTLANLNATYVRMVFPMTGVGDYPMLSIDNPIEYTMEGFLADGVKVKGENVIGNVGETTPDWVATKELAGGENTYIPEQTVSGGIWNKLQMAMQAGMEYDVTLNGEVYSCVARANGSGVYLGNNTSLSLNDYPFCISWAGGTATSGMFFKNSEVISDPVKLKVTDHVYYVYDKMPEGYLPECVVKSVNGVEPDYYGNVDIEVPSGSGVDVTASVGQTIVVEEVDANGKPTKWKAADFQEKICGSELAEILPGITVEIDPEMGIGLIPDITLEVGAEYTVTYNGVEYTVSNATDFDGDGTPECMGNMGGIDESMPTTEHPFFIACEINDDGSRIWMIAPFDGSASVTLSITEVKTTPIPVEYVTNAFPYYIEVTGSGMDADPYVCNDTVANVNAIYKSGRPVGACRIAVDNESGTTSKRYMQLNTIIEFDGGITYGFYELDAYTPTRNPNLTPLWLIPKDDGTFDASRTFG